jgi:hypothetical protein
MGFHGLATVHKPKITMHNAKCRLELSKARCHWTVETCPSGSLMDESGFGGCQGSATCPNS